jgi:hypothetical protein
MTGNQVVCSTTFPLLFVVLAVPAWGYKPEDAEVKGMVERGLKYLETAPVKDVEGISGTIDSIHILSGYAAFKAGKDPSYPLVGKGLDTALRIVRTRFDPNARQPLEGAGEAGGGSGRSGGSGGIYEGHERSYELTMALLLLAELDPVGYRADIQMAVDFGVKIQLGEGSWGYPHEPFGDTSQTQYVMLGLWAADRAGAKVPPGTMEKGLNWLIKTQQGGGGFMYRPTMPDRKGHPDWYNFRKPLVLAGLGTALIAGDYFKFYVGTGESGEDIGLPKALRRVVPKSGRSTSIKPATVGGLAKKGDSWLDGNNSQRKPDDWHYYTMYAAERYFSFKELSEGLQVPEPDWYNSGVRELIKNQAPNGAWGLTDVSKEGPVVSTALAVLFLVRSTKKAIAKTAVGALQGGYELPKNVKNAKIKDGKVQGESAAGSITDMLAILEGDGADDVDPNTIPDALPLSKDPVERADQISRFQRLARGQVNGSYIARRLAVRTLVQSDEFSVVPTLIFALSDPDIKVHTMARDGLRMISRRFDDGFGFSETIKLEEIPMMQRAWKKWYLEFNPSYQFID